MASTIASSHRVWPLHGGETGALIRARDWSATPLGDVRQWSERFRSSVDTCLDAAFACFVWWGPELVQIYNDAALPVVRARHPASFGVPAREAWPDIWPAVAPVVARVMTSGTPVLGACLPLSRPGAGPASLTLSCSALRDATGAAAGVLVTAFDMAGTAAGPPPRYPALFEAVAGYVSLSFDTIYGETCENVVRGDNLASWPDLFVQGDRKTALAYEYPVEPLDGEELRWVPAGFPLAKPEISDCPHSIVPKPAAAGLDRGDATGGDAAADRMEMMVAELQHRTRNLIAVVRAIIGRTLATSSSPDVFWRRIDDRLRALSRVQGLLSRAGQEPITIGALVHLELDDEEMARRSAREERLHIAGPAVRLRSSIAQTLALALHELAANARKYGALSTAGGRLRIGWQLERRENRSWLLLNWIEETTRRSGVPPPRTGYGRSFIEHALSYSHGADTRYELDETGLRCSIALPLGTDPSEERRP